jgi:hypothetical protein
VIPLLHSKATRDFLDILLSNENGYQLNNGYVFSEKNGRRSPNGTNLE